MNKDIESWINKNNPYCKTHPCNACLNNIFSNQCQISPSDCEKYKTLINVKYGWQEGAKAMAEYLEQRNRTENDTAFLLGMESANGVQLFGIEQPPTKEQIKIILDALVWCSDNYMPSVDELENDINEVLRYLTDED